MYSKKKLNYLFLRFLLNNGFCSMDNVLELGNQVKDSMSLILSENNCNEFFLSKYVTLEELKQFKVRGINGYILNNNIVTNNNQVIDFPKLENFDTVISIGCDREKVKVINSLKNIKKFIGQCVAYNQFHDFPYYETIFQRYVYQRFSEKKYYDNLYQEEYEKMDTNKYELITNVESDKGLGYYLIMKRQ